MAQTNNENKIIDIDTNDLASNKVNIIDESNLKERHAPDELESYQDYNFSHKPLSTKGDALHSELARQQMYEGLMQVGMNIGSNQFATRPHITQRPKT